MVSRSFRGAAALAIALGCAFGLSVPATAVVPAGTLALDFNSANRDVAFGVANCGERPGLSTTATTPIEGSHSAFTGTLTASAINDYRSAVQQIVPGASQLSVRTRLSTTPGVTGPYVEAAWLQSDGTRLVLGRRALTNSTVLQTWTVPASASQRGRVELVFRTTSGNANQRARFDTLRLTSSRQATSAAAPAGIAGSAGCRVEAPSEVILSPAAQTVVVGEVAPVSITLSNPNTKPLTTEAEVLVTLASGEATGTAGACGFVVRSALEVVLTAGTTIPIGGCTQALSVTSSAVTDATIDVAPAAVTTEAGASGTGSQAVVEFIAPAAPVAGDDSVSVVAGGSVQVGLLGNDTATAPAVVDGGSVDLDPDTAGRQDTVTVGPFTLSVDGAGELTVASASAGPPPATGTARYTVADSYGTPSAPATITLAEAAPAAPVAGDDSVSVVAGGSVQVGLLGNDTATAPAVVDGGSVDLDPDTAGRQDTVTVGPFTLSVDGAGELTVASASAGPPPATGTARYTVADSYGTPSAPATITLAEAAPAAPVAGDDSVSVVAGGSVQVGLLGNDTATAPAVVDGGSVDLDPDTAGRQDTVTVGPFTLSVDGAGELTVASASAGPPPATGTARYTVADSYGTPSAPATITLAEAAPAAPVAGDDSVSVVAGGSVQVGLLGNDTATAPAVVDGGSVDLDPDTAGRQDTVTVGPFTLSVDGAGELTVASASAGPPPATGTARYTVADSYGTPSAPATITLAEAAPAAPVAGDDSVSVVAGGSVQVGLLGNDTATAPAVVDGGSVDLDPDTAGRQDTVTVGPFTLSVDGAGELTVASASAGPPPATGTARYTVADSYGTPSEPATITLAEAVASPSPSPTETTAPTVAPTAPSATGDLAKTGTEVAALLATAAALLALGGAMRSRANRQH